MDENIINKKQKMLWFASSLLSSSSDSDEEYYPLLGERKTLPKIKYFEDVISKFDANQASIFVCSLLKIVLL